MTRIFPHSGVCANCRRERDDLFWHRFAEAFYCADVFRCEARFQIQSARHRPRDSPQFGERASQKDVR